MAISIQGAQYQQPQANNPGGLSRGTQDRIRNDVKALSTALQSGDLKGAQDSYGDLQKLLQGNGAISQAGTSASPTGPLTAIKSDFQALGQALGSGDIAGAQNDYAQLATDSAQVLAQQQQDGGSTRARGHHHHRIHPEPPVDSDGNSVTNSGTAPSSTSPVSTPAAAQQISAYQFSYQASYQSVNTTASGSTPAGNYQVNTFQESFKGFSVANTSTDPISLNQPLAGSAYQYSYQASFQSISYLG